MANEEVKLDLNVQAVRAGQTAQKAEPQKSQAVTNVFEGFKKYAKKLGFELSTEKVQEFINSNPDILSKTPEELDKAFRNFVSSQKTPVNESPTAGTTAAEAPADSQQANPFGAASDTDIQNLLQNIAKAENANDTQSAKTEPKFFQSKLSATDTPAEAQPAAASSKTSSPERTAQSTPEAASEDELSDKDREEMVRRHRQVSGKKVSRAKKDGIGENFDAKEYEEKSKTDKVKSYALAYAKNAFIHSSNPPHTEEEWNNLSNQEKAKFIREGEAYLDKSGAKAQKLISQFLGKDANAEEALMQMRMAELQTAERLGISLQEFNQKNEIEQLAHLADTIETKYKESPDKLSSMEALIYSEAVTLRDAVKYALEKSGEQGVDNLSFEQAYNIAISQDKKMPLGTIIKDYLNSIPEDKRTELQKLTLDTLNSIPSQYLETFATKMGPTDLEIAVSQNEEYKERYAKASVEERAQMTAEYYMKTCGDDPEAFVRNYQAAIEHGNFNELGVLLQLVAQGKLPECAKVLPKVQGNLDFALTLTSEKGMEALGDKAGEYTQNVDAIAQDKIKQDPEKYNNFYNLFVQSLSNNGNADQYKQLTADAKQYSYDLQRAIGKNHTEVINSSKYSPEVMDQLNQNIKEAGGAVIEGFTDNLDKIDADKQNDVFDKIYVGNKGNLDIFANREGILKIHDDNKHSIYSKAKNSIEEVCDKDEAIRLLNRMSDSIPKCSSQVQGKLHEVASSSKYSEVRAHAAQNIHKYDASVQADAMRSTFASGDERAIEIVIANLDLISASAIAAMRNEINAQIEAMESRHLEDLLSDYAKQKLGRDLEGVSQKSPEYSSKVKAYIAELKKLPQSELYQRICTDFRTWPTSLQTLVLDKIAKYNPKLLTMFIDKYGIKLLTGFGQVNIATKNSILKEMLKTPSKRAEAMEYIRSNSGGNFSDSVKDLYNKIVAEREGDDYDSVKAKKQEDTENDQSYQTSAVFGSQSGSTRTNLNRDEDDYWKTKANLNAYLA